MEQKVGQQITNKSGVSNEINQIAMGGLMKRKQIQGLQKKSNGCSVNQNIDNTQRGEEGLKINNGDTALFRCKIMIGTLTLVEFSLIIAIIILSYLSSKIELSLLIVVIAIIALIHAIVLATLTLLTPTTFLASSSQPIEMLEGGEMPTVPKINQQLRISNSLKTKKIKYPIGEGFPQQISQQRLKKQGEASKQIKEFHNIRFTTLRNIIIVSKSLQGLFQILIPLLILLFFDPSQTPHLRISLIVLTTTTLLSFIASSILLYFLIQTIQNAKLPKEQSKLTHQQQSQPKSIISIDLAFKPKVKANSMVEQRIVKASKESKSVQQRDSGKPILPLQNKQIQKICQSLKRPVLKNKQKKISGDILEQLTIERRKVEINSKKIEYFQYSEISASHSVAEEQQAKNKIAKSKYHMQKIANQHQKLEHQQKILQNKILERERKARSEANSKKKEEAKEDDQIKPDYFC